MEGFSSAPETATPPSHGDAMNFWDEVEGKAESTGIFGEGIVKGGFWGGL